MLLMRGFMLRRLFPSPDSSSSPTLTTSASEPDIAPTDSSRAEIVHTYEQKRRLALARTLLPIFVGIQGGVFVVSVLFLFTTSYQFPTEQIFIFNTALVGMDAALHGIGLSFVRRGQVAQATLCVIVPVGITVVVPLLMYDLLDRAALTANSPFFAITLSEMAATFVLIVLTGLIAQRRISLLITTVAINGYTAFILMTALQIPGMGTALRPEALLLITFPLLSQWAVAGILFASSGTYQQTLGELGDVRVAYARAQQLDQLKDQFITHVNHELRSPVMALQGHVELLLLTMETLSPEERRTYLLRAKRAGDDLVALVMRVLAVRRLEQENETVAPEIVPIREALEGAARLVDPRDGQQVERELRVHVPEDLAAWADPVRVRQVLTNLLSNALKYSPPGSEVEVSAKIMPLPPASASRRQQRRDTNGQQQRQMVDIAIRDHGLGIPPEQIPLLFRRFVRLPRDMASQVPGTGLGLYLCRVLAEAMGGTIWAESTGVEGEGTTFHFELPAPPTTTDPVSQAESNTYRATPGAVHS